MRTFSADPTALLESITDAFFALDDEWRFVYLNREAERVLRRPREELLGKSVWEEFPEAVDSTFYREYHRAMNRRESVEFEEYYPPLETWFEVKAYPSEAGLSVCFRDINERKRAEEELKEYEERLRAILVQYASDIITIVEADGTIRYESPAIERVLGYKPEELVGTRVFDHLHPDDVERAQSVLRKVLEEPGAGGSGGPLEVRFRHADGSWRYLEGIGNNLLSDPAVRGVVVNSRDVTERKWAEERLREAEGRYRTLVEQIPAAVYTLDPNDRYAVRYISPRIEAITGYSPREYVSDPGFWIEVMHPEDRERALAAGATLSDAGGQPISLEYRQYARDGRLVWVRDEVTVVRDEAGRPLFLQGVLSDITERKEAEEALRRSGKSLATAQRLAHTGSWEYDMEKGEVWWSDEHFRILGLSPGQIDPRPETFSEYVHPEDKELVERWRRNPLRNEKPTVAEFRVVRPDGEVRFVQMHREAERDEAGRLVKTTGTVQDVTERRRAEEALRESEERFKALIQNALDVITVIDADGTIRYESPSVERVLGHKPEEKVGTNALDHVHPEDVGRMRRALAGGLNITGTTGKRFEFRSRHKDGSWRYLEAFGSNLLSDRSVGGIVVNARDVTERKEAEEELKKSEHELAEAQRIAHVGSWSYDVEGDEARWSDEMYRIFGFAPQEFAITYTKFFKLVHPDDAGLIRRAAREVLYGNRDRYSTDYRLVRPDGEVRFLHSEYEVVRNEESGRPVRLVGTSQDVTERKALEERLEHQALHDPLTGLPNRVLLMDRLRNALARVKRRGGKVAVLFVDLDNFKYVNDSLGHEAGDELLVGAAGRLRECLRPEDTFARLGGDEFAVLLEGVEGTSEAKRVAGRVIKELRPPFTLVRSPGQEVFVTPSIGISLGGPGDAPEELIRKADVAMYRAKGEGKARHKVFAPGMEARVARRLEMENDLRRALERGEFELRYQPVVRLGTGGIAGFEALARWEHPERGLVLPSEFLPLAEEVGLIVPIGQRVLRRACRQAREWQERNPGSDDPPLSMGVNISARQLSHPGLVGEVGKALDESGLDPRRLTLEIAESAVAGDEERRMGVLRRLSGLGVRFAIDDFGTGYSSLSYLKRLPAGMLKIDRSFVESIGGDAADEVLVSGMVHVASGLGMSVLAEGVETAEQLERVKKLGCHMAQGYYFSEPLSAEAAGELLAAHGIQP